MHDQSSNPCDVVIAGAGPVGLFLACELRLAGLQVLVLEQSQDSHSALKQLPFGLRGLSIPTLEAFHRRGMLEQIVAAQQLASGAIKSAAHWMQQTQRPAGHFAGIQFYQDNIDVTKWSWRLPTSADANLAVDMETLESVLAARACSMGVEIRRGFGVNAVVASSKDVTVQAAGETFRARWLVGCDGARSTVRKTGGFDFVGTDPEFTGYATWLATIPFDDPYLTQAIRVYFGVGTATNSGVVGPDNADFGWLKRFPQLCDIPPVDVTLTGQNFVSIDKDTSEQKVTGAYVPYGTPTSPGQVIPALNRLFAIRCSWPPANWCPLWTTRWSWFRQAQPPRIASSPTATSTGRRSPMCSTSRPSSPPTSPRSASGVRIASSTAPEAMASRRSSPTTREWTAGS